MDPQVGQIINNKYRLLRLIGDGGMGSVFEAKHELLGTTVALKFLHNQLARRKGLVERFLQEAQVSARIRSPHVVSVSDVDRTTDGLAYMVMEFVEGETLQTLYEKLYQSGERLTYGDAFDIMLQMLEGVSAAHSLGIVHRDLKPDNVMLTEDPRSGRLVKILDFGIAKLKASGEVDRGLTRPGVVMGTPEYMAPEQAFSADKVDARADVFSLGVMFFEMLAGRRPVGGDNAHAIAAQYLEGTIAQLGDLMPSVAPKLAAAVHKAMGAKPDERFDSVDAFRAAIAPYAPDGAGTAASKPDEDGAEQADALAETAGASLNDGRETPIPKTVPPEQIFSNGGVGAQTAGGADTGASTTGGGTASMASVGDRGPSNGAASQSSDGAEGPSPFRAGTEPMPEGAVQAQLAMRSSTVTDESAGGPSGSTQVGEPFGPGGYPASPGAAAPAPAGSPNFGASPGRSGKKKGPPLLAILLIAAGVSAAVVGGVYVAHEAGAREAEDDDPIDVSTPPPATVVQETPPPTPQPPTVTTPPTPVPPPQPPPPPAQPPPKPQPPKPQPPTQPPTQPPPSPPPFVIPSALPGLPGLPGLTPPQPPPPAQPPPPTGGKKPSILKPGGAGQPKPQSTGGTSEPPKAKPSILRRPRVKLPRSGGASSGSKAPSPERPSSDQGPSILFPKLRR